MARKMIKGSTGTPMTAAIGVMEVRKLVWPGRPTEPTVVRTAMAAPAAIVCGAKARPRTCAV
ncbi:hypothetical protein D3C80_1618300 [compost metagenome]